MAQMKVYAKWKAVQISSAIENGEVPQAGMIHAIFSHVFCSLL